MSANKARGTRWETACVNALRIAGFLWADRVPLSGARDRGDVTVGPGSPVMQAKSVNRYDLSGAVDDAEEQARNAKAPFGVAWLKRKGKQSALDGYVVMSGRTWVQVLAALGYLPDQPEQPIPGQLAVDE